MLSALGDRMFLILETTWQESMGSETWPWEIDSLKLSTPRVRIYLIITNLSPQGLSFPPFKSTWLHHSFFRNQSLGGHGLWDYTFSEETEQATSWAVGTFHLRNHALPVCDSCSKHTNTKVYAVVSWSSATGQAVSSMKVGSVVSVLGVTSHRHLHHHLLFSSLSYLGLVLLIKTLLLETIYHPLTLW